MNPNHLLVGCPPGFDLVDRLGSADSVQLAMAFAKSSGWRLLSDSLLSGGKTVEIVVGLNFGITDPKLLEKWLSLSGELSSRFKVRVAPWRPTFHPKVIIARFKDGSGFAIVGSGNLTGGGQHSNVECSVLLTEVSDIVQLESWLKRLKSTPQSTPLNQRIIDEYRPLNLRAKELEKSAIESSDLTTALSGGSCNWYKNLFICEFAEFLSTCPGSKSVKQRVEAARSIRAALRMPTFDFDKSGFLDFFKTRQFGKIREGFPDMPRHLAALRRTMLFLTTKPLDLDRFESVFNSNGRHHVEGFGPNLISKVLTVYDRRRWPILNRPMWKTLRHYGYKIPWRAAGYLKFAQDMREWLQEAGKLDFWAFDAFCETKSHKV